MLYTTFICTTFQFIQILTKDSVTVAVDAVIYIRIFDATMATVNVSDAYQSTRLLAATTLRNVLGTRNMSELLTDRESIASNMKVICRILLYGLNHITNFQVPLL